jgi:hypothetical protein
MLKHEAKAATDFTADVADDKSACIIDFSGEVLNRSLALIGLPHLYNIRCPSPA